MSLEASFRIERGDFTLAVDLRLPGRGVTALFGPSGCGKTTLLRAIAGLDRHPGGRLRLGGATWQEGTLFVPPHRRALGYVFQEPSLFPHLTVRGNLEYGSRRASGGGPPVPLDETVELLEIGGLLDRRPEGLSGGERQRVAIARALAARPRILLMDEPLASLEPERRRDILPYLEALHRRLEIPVLYVSHQHDEVARLADHLVLLRAGSVVGSGPITEMLTRLDLPLARGVEAESLIEATVAAHDDDFELTHLDAASVRFTVTRRELSIGHRVRLRIAARDVSLALTAHPDTSILNIFPAVVDELTAEAPGEVIVRLLVGDVAMLSRVTARSAAMLSLEPGARVHAQVKSVALLA